MRGWGTRRQHSNPWNPLTICPSWVVADDGTTIAEPLQGTRSHAGF